MPRRDRRLDIRDAVRYLEHVATDAPGTPRQIRRYENRKLYDAAERRYVTLEELRARVASGQDVEVFDQRTGEDLTTLTLAQILLEGLRGSTARVPRQVLTRLVRLAFAPAEDGADGHPGPQEAAARARREAERIAGKLLAKGRMTLEEGLALRQELAGTVHEIVAEAQAGLEARLRGLFSPAADGPHASLLGLKERIDALSASVGSPPRGAAGATAKRRKKSKR
jgi:polyhydroxyalkanoate synthesis repressor PhaR